MSNIKVDPLYANVPSTGDILISKTDNIPAPLELNAGERTGDKQVKHKTSREGNSHCKCYEENQVL